MIDISLMSKQEKIIIISILGVVFITLGIMFTPAKMRNERKSSAPANVLSSGGGPGTDKGYFQTPRDIAVDSEGNIYVVDSKNHRVQKFNSSGVFLMAWGKEGDKEGQFKEPCGIDVGKDNSVYVTDTWNGRIQVFDSKGKFIRQFGKDKGMWGPRDAAVDPQGNVYVCDTGWGKIEKFDAKGVSVASFGKKGGDTGPGDYREPFSAKIGPDGNLYVADRKNFRIQVINTKDGSQVRQFKVDGWAEGQIVNGCLMEPYIDIDPKRGEIYITDSSTRSVLKYKLDGKDKKVFAKDQNGGDMFGCPLGVAYAGNGLVLISDSGRSKIITFSATER